MNKCTRMNDLAGSCGLPLIRRANIHPMVRGYSEVWSGFISTDRKCPGDKNFCDFSSHGLAHDTYKCDGCNEELKESAFEWITEDELTDSRDRQMPDGW